MRAFDWSRTDVGFPAQWSRSLRAYVAMVLEMPTPAILFWGPNQTQIYNDGYTAIMGPRHPTYLGASFASCWPDTYPMIYPLMRRVLEEGDVVRADSDLYVVTRHGFAEEAYFTFTFSPLRDDDGEIAGVLQPVLEVTQSVLRERRSEVLGKLAAQVDAPRPVLDAAAAALADEPADVPMALIYVVQPDGRLSLEARTGWGAEPLDELASAPVARIAERAYRSGDAQLIEDLPAALGGRQHVGPWPEPTQRAYVLPLRRSAADAPRGAAVLALSPRLHFDDKYREFFTSIARELAANLAAEQAKSVERNLLERERNARREAELQKQHLDSLLNQAPTPMVVLRGAEFVIELANPLACRLWMRGQNEVVGRPVLEALPEIRGQVFEELLKKVYRTGETHVGTEALARLAKPEGGFEEVYLNFVYAPLLTTHGVDGVLVIAFDVTEQVRAREQINELRNAAEAASRAKDEFFAVLGHELRNPLAPILTALELMRLRGARGVERERSVIERQAQHLVRLVDDLLDVSRITRGKIELKKERVNVAAVVAQAVETALPMIEERRHELSIDVPSEAAVEADPGRFAQAVANLLTNAAKYTEPGGRISVFGVQRDGQLEVVVRDTGIGIDRDMLPRVFDVFVQERQTLARSDGGLGLGLAIVHGIVDLHGGSVDVRSEGRGHGSEFAIRLPMAPDAEQGELPSRTVSASGQVEEAGGRAILVVDDNEDAADTLAASLEGAGHEVHVAYDAPGALRAAKQRPPELALLDIGLPVMDGYELARQLREIPGLEGLAAIAVTGYGQASDRARSREAGFDAHLVKPVDPRELEALVRDLPGRRSWPGNGPDRS